MGKHTPDGRVCPHCGWDMDPHNCERVLAHFNFDKEEKPMSEKEGHMPEPWAFDFVYGELHCFRGALGDIGTCIRRIDAERIVACVNACADIPTEQLETGCVEGLIKALEEMLDSHSKISATPLRHRQTVKAAARRALAPFQKD